LGPVLRAQGKLDVAYDSFYRVREDQAAHVWARPQWSAIQ
jgi:hypothetical protein